MVKVFDRYGNPRVGDYGSSELVVAYLEGATIPAATVASGDEVLVFDASDSFSLKKVTAQAIADLGGGGGSGVTDGDKGDISVTSGGTVWTIKNSAVGDTKISDVNWSKLVDVPVSFAPSAHTHPVAEISDSTLAGRNMVTAADAAAQRTLLTVETTTQLNSRDTNNRDRSNHTGTQLAATISDLGDSATLDVGTSAGTVAAGDHNHSGVYDPAGTASSAVSTHVGLSDPHSQYQLESEKGAANGYAPLNASSLIIDSFLTANIARLDAAATWTDEHSFDGTVDFNDQASFYGTAPQSAVAATLSNHLARLGEVTSAVSTHSSTTSGVHGISGFGASLVDDADDVAARSTLGLGDAATKNVGTSAGTVAAGDHNHSGVYDPTGTASAAVSGHELDLDPHTQYQLESGKDASNGYAGLDVSGRLVHTKIGISATNSLLGTTTSSGAASLITCTLAGRDLIDDADAAAQRATLELGDAATKNVGTSAGTVAAGDHNHSGVYDPAGTAASAVSSHAAATSGVHGISAYGATLISQTDERDARDILLLGNSATKHVGTAADTVAAGDHNHSGVYDPAGTASSAVSAHAAASDPHTEYSKADGTRAFTGVVSGVDPSSSAHLATKNYVDAQDSSLLLTSISTFANIGWTFLTTEDSLSFLTNHRRITFESGVLSATDGGAQSTYQINLVNNGVPLGKLPQVSEGDFIGRVSSGTGNLEAVSGYNAKSSLQLCTPEYSQHFTDFLNANNGTHGYSTNTTGTGASAAYQAWEVTSGYGPVAGILALRTGTTDTGRAAILTGSNTLDLDNGFEVTFEVSAMMLSLATGTDDFVASIGIGNQPTTSAEDSNFVGFVYRRATDGDFWVCITRDGGTETKTVTAVAPSTSAFQIVRLVVSQDKSSVVFSIGGSVVATHTTNISSSRMGNHMKIYKTAGTTNCDMYLDYANLLLRRPEGR